MYVRQRDGRDKRAVDLEREKERKVLPCRCSPCSSTLSHGSDTTRSALSICLVSLSLPSINRGKQRETEGNRGFSFVLLFIFPFRFPVLCQSSVLSHTAEETVERERERERKRVGWRLRASFRCRSVLRLTCLRWPLRFFPFGLEINLRGPTRELPR
jgi:hypothetical protein